MSEVARRHGLTPQQVFGWRRGLRPERAEADRIAFVPAVLEAMPDPAAPEPRPRRSRRRSASSANEPTIDGVAVRVGADASPKAIAAVIKALKAGA